ncbi:basement membrane-specific heparan sulfate proteoglycan core protein [Aplysia californica]|uniref:Basement membrane-specific heparan sulfate proteoglycan core protein n=1 Tax=Aplysia californica TaxID=6500 RepID=A0ABM1ACK6_APLCA|nr:basement membrane-specific heparan sulfate proteoglycan core protein [Aplysia californica]
MMIDFKLPLAAVLALSAYVTLVRSTVCETGNNYCMDTLYVTDRCDGTNCACTSGYQAILTGCGESTEITNFVDPYKPTINANQYSGEVYWKSGGSGGSLDLFCVSSYSGVGAAYKWFNDSGAEIDGETAQKYTARVTADDPLAYTCQVNHAGTYVSDKSQPFTVTGYTDSGTISQPPAITNMPAQTVVGGKIPALTCTNIPKEPAGTALDITWSNSYTRTEVTATATSAQVEGGGVVACTIKPGDGSARGITVTTNTSEEVATTIVAKTAVGVEISSPATDTTIEEGTTVALTCSVTPAGAVYGTSDLTAVTWEKGGTAVAGATTLMYTVPSTEAVGEHTFTCKAKFDARDVSASRKITIQAASAGVEKAEVIVVPQSPVADSYVVVKCLVTAGSLDNLKYYWSFRGILIVGQHDHTLQVNKATATDINGDYTCKVAKKGTNIEKSDTTSVAIASDLAKPSLTAPVGPSDMIEGTQYQLTCTSASYTKAMTFELRGGAKTLQSTDGMFKVVATSTATDYKCVTIVGSRNKESDVITVQGKDLVSVQISGASTWVTGAAAKLTCTPNKAENIAVTYAWKKAGVAITDETGPILVVATPPAAGTHTYTCDVTPFGGTMKSGAITITVQAKPATPTVNPNAATLNLGGKYTLTCSSASAVDSATYTWSKDGDDLRVTSARYVIPAMTAVDAGDYICTIKVNEQTSTSSPMSVPAPGAKGLQCTKTDFTTTCSDARAYSGNCLAGRCECARNVKLQSNSCGSNPGARVSVSLLVLVVTCLSGLLVRL